jgi:hypothetical protein
MEANKTKEAWETPKLSVLNIDGTKHGTRCERLRPFQAYDFFHNTAGGLYIIMIPKTRSFEFHALRRKISRA